MEINGIFPLPHYYEEIYANQVGIKKLGMRGDENYLFYSVDGLGAGYYEKNEMEKSAISVYEHFKLKSNRTDFFKCIEKLLSDLDQFTKKIDNLDFNDVSDKLIARYFLEANQMHGRSFSYYIVSQPYRMSVFENELRSELSKRVATSRIDAYMTELAASEKPTKINHEEQDWLSFLIKYKTKYGDNLDIKKIKDGYPTMYSDLQVHFDNYKSLTLGDGNWSYDINHYINNLKNDYPKSLDELKNTLNEKTNYPRLTKENREKLIKDLYLNDKTIEDLDFLAEIGHTRLRMRIEGWLPFVSTIIKLDIELSKRLKIGNLLNYATEEELINIAEGGEVVPETELLRRKGKRSEFLILHDHGVYKIFYGKDANIKFKELVPEVDHAAITELQGTSAYLGSIKGKACIYRWDDNLESKLEVIKKYPILITGQTRPSMMPIIRLAKGIVTDEGGITSHAAIVCRELKIPSVIGTIHATKVFKDGDMIELDANNGIVRRIQ